MSNAERNYTPPVSSAQTSPASQPVVETPATLRDIEADHIRQLLDRFRGNRKKVANSLGVSERTIYRKLKKLDLA